MRLSSISSQDSGFTSQDTLFTRPGSPGKNKVTLYRTFPQKIKYCFRRHFLLYTKQPFQVLHGSDVDAASLGQGSNGNDRPHTISSAYEKGHQRPQLQPYTFQPPENQMDAVRLTIILSLFFFVFVESCRSRINKSFTPQVESRSGTLRKPPVPQRCVSLDGSSVSVPMPTGPKPALPSGKKPHITGQQQQQQHPGGQGMPDFSLNKSDMGEK